VKPTIINSTTKRMHPRAPAPLILTYHTISPQSSKFVYSASCQQFEEHLTWLSDLSVHVGLETLPQITFDDGKLSDYEFALPLLEKYQIRATFFVTAGLIGNNSGFMDWQQVRAISSLGHSVQSHGWSHLLITRASATELHRELEASKCELEDRLGVRVTSISLPGGRWNPKVLEACARTGYQRVCHSDPWTPVERRHDFEFVGRLMVRNSMRAKNLNDVSRGRFPIVFYYRSQFWLKEAGKRVIGDRMYHWLWQTLAGADRRPLKARDADLV